MKKIFFTIILLPLLSFSVHKYYIALTEIEYKEETKSVQMIMNVFIDDIETVINREYNIDSQLSYKEEIKNVDSFFKKYLTENFQITINNEFKKHNFIGKEYEGDIVYFYLEIENVSEIKTMEINNTLLIKQFPHQQNIIKVKNNDDSESLFLTQKKHKALLKF